MKQTLSALFLAAAIATTPVLVIADAAPTVKYSTEDSTVGDLLDNPKTKAILDKYLPGFSSADQISMARGMTLKGVQPFAPDTVTDDALAKIDAELAKLGAAK